MKRARILLVDDEVVFANNMCRLLQSRGYHPVAVNSGESALELLREREFDVVVLDLRMPGLDGVTTLREIRDARHPAEVLILTGHGAIDSAFEAVKLGAFDYLAKPCAVEDLVAKIDAASAKKESRRHDELEERLRRLVQSPEETER